MRPTSLLRHYHGAHIRTALFTKTPGLMAALKANPGYTGSMGTASASTAVSAPPVPPLPSQYEIRYDPSKILQHPEFKKLPKGSPELDDKTRNLACCYNPAHEVNMVNKPVPKAGEGECVVHIRATGICG